VAHARLTWPPGIPAPSASSTRRWVAYTSGGRKLLWHTTEGYSLPRYSGSNPHFTLHPATGQLWQHQPITEPSRALVHSPGTPETNRANVVQVELIGFAAQTHDWPDAYYGNIAALARWIEANHGVPSKSTVAFTSTATHQARRMTGAEFIAYSGHCGHEHAPPNNVHWDPSRFRIGDVLADPTPAPVPDPYAYRGTVLSRGSKGTAVKLVQGWINRLVARHPGHYRKLAVDGKFGALTKANVVAFQRRHDLVADGRVGPITWNALRKAAV
jgi:hypothetical protein